MTNRLVGLLLAMVVVLQGSAQSFPTNMNLVANGGLEFGMSRYIWVPTPYTFINNKFCWISANWGRSGLTNSYIFLKNYSSSLGFGTGSIINFTSGFNFNIKTGVWDTSPNFGQFRRVYTETQLLAPLVAGKTYYFRMYFLCYVDSVFHKNPHGFKNPGTDILANVGAYFSDSVLSDSNNKGPFWVKPQLNFTKHRARDSGIVEVTKLSGSFVAKGGERYLTIGNFDSVQNFELYYLTPDSRDYGKTYGFFNSAVIDKISLVEDTTQPMINLDYFSLGPDTVLCAKQKMRLNGDNPNFFHYWWSTGDTTKSILIDTPGTYWCTVDYGCGNYTDTIHVYGPLQAYRLEDTLRLCNAQLPYTFRLPQRAENNPTVLHHWSDGSRGDTLLVRSAGIYYYYRSSACGVTKDTVRLVVEVPLGGTPAYLPDTTICLGDSLVLYGGSGYQTYRWSTGDTTQSILVRAAGTYSIMARTACDSFQATAHIQTLAPPPAFSLGADTALCPDVVLLLQAPGGYTYTWAPIGGNKSYLSVRDTGYYTCTMSNRCGQSVAGIHIGRILPPEGDVGIYGDSSLCRNEVLVPATLYNHSAYQKWWSTGSEEDAITVTRPGLYTLALYNRCGIHKESLYLHGCKGILAFPNAFSPNGDGRNDVFRPLIQDGTFIAYYALKIFNRWGQQVFVSYHADYGWGAERCDVGTYFYSCRYKEWGKEEVVLTGEIELLK